MLYINLSIIFFLKKGHLTSSKIFFRIDEICQIVHIFINNNYIAHNV